MKLQHFKRHHSLVVVLSFFVMVSILMICTYNVFVRCYDDVLTILRFTINDHIAAEKVQLFSKPVQQDVDDIIDTYANLNHSSIRSIGDSLEYEMKSPHSATKISKSTVNLDTIEVNIYTHCFVTAFMDIDRYKWIDSKRSNEEYLKRFTRLIRVPEPMVIFIDKRLFHNVTTIVEEYRPRGIYTTIIPIDFNFLEKYIYTWKLLEIERSIMNSTKYLEKVPQHLRHLPEHSIPEYTLINHAKIDFVNFVIAHIHTCTTAAVGGDEKGEAGILVS